MLKSRFVVLLTAGALASGLGAAVAIADDGSTDPAAGATCAALVAPPAPQDQNNQFGVDEEATANDVADAATDVQVEAADQSADDQSGDQQGPNDESEEPDDDCQND